MRLFGRAAPLIVILGVAVIGCGRNEGPQNTKPNKDGDNVSSPTTGNMVTLSVPDMV